MILRYDQGMDTPNETPRPNNPAIESLAREVLTADKVRDDTPGTLYLDGPTHEHEEAAGAILDAAPALAHAVIAVSELHRPIRVYDDCGDPECLNDHVWIADTVACEDSAIGWACARCCYYGEHPLECADHKGDHKGVPQVRACATRAALNGDDQ